MQKRIAFVLIFAVFMSLFSCAKNDPMETGDSGISVMETTETESERDARSEALAALPDEKFDGYSFRVLTGPSNFAIMDVDTEEMNGEIINDTIFTRNRTVEERLNIRISSLIMPGYEDPQNTLKAMVAAGDDIWDVVFSESAISAPSAADGWFLNLYDIDGIDWEQPWWENNIRKYFEISGCLYFTHTPMQLHYYESLVTPLFNKDIVADYGLDNPYEYVMNGTWTMDKMVTMGLSVINDVNADGKMSPADDMFAISDSPNLIQYLPIGAGYRYTTTEEGDIRYEGMTERLVSIVETYSRLFAEKNATITDSVPGVRDYPLGYIGLFAAGHSLFYLDVLGRVKDLRTMDADFGILPLPKYDEDQPAYISTNYTGASILIVPITNQHLAVTGAALECLSAYSYFDLIPAYYEINIQGKQIRDEESIAVLDLMLSNITCDMNLIFGWGNVGDTISDVIMKGSPVASAMKSTDTKVNTAMQAFLEKFGAF